MKLGRPLFKELLEDTLNVFEQNIIKLPHPVEVKFQSREDYISAVKQNPLIQQQIQLGFYKDIEKEYVGFAVVYEKDKLELKAMLGLPYTITICDEIAKEALKPFNSREVKAYMTHVYLHELTHIFEPQIVAERNDLWEKAMGITHNNVAMAKEMFAELVADIVSKDKQLYEDVEKRVWSKLFARMQQIKKERGL